MSAIIDLGERRRAIVDLCEELGLDVQVRCLRAKRCEHASWLRPLLVEIRGIAAAVNMVARKSRVEAIAVVEVEGIDGATAILDLQVDRSARLERACTEAIAVADTVIAELDAANAKGADPGLRPSARPMGGFR